MSQRIGFWSQLWLNVRKSWGIHRAREKFIGSDYLGNTYYELEKSESERAKKSRYVKSRDGDEWNSPKIPTEWDSWLRGRREDPPSLEEVDLNHQKMLAKQAKARELEAHDELVQQQDYEQGNIQRNLPSKNKSAFPQYPEYSSGDMKKDSGS
ncbi:NADH dehydrogenase [ubiquinone] 1 alpha subcomplex assembly factor 2-like [Tubulanus polymorphus]|uniref:NADH dehydrogenase [ubiquinone] 1 alpha subcomplex assembly factor 2-like n=1 Tax=Tubulanus polymorphus TaxID=672921 RepID=UPI003DA37D2F